MSGGGAKNLFLMKRISELMESDQICVENIKETSESKFGVNSDNKEAVGFAILGLSNLMGVSANVPSVTFSKTQEILGKISPTINFFSLVKSLIIF